MQISTRNLKIPLIFLAVAFILVLFLPRNAKFAYDYRKGLPWEYETLFAQFDFPIIKTEEQIREERTNASIKLVPYYRYSSELVKENLLRLDRMKLPEFKEDIASQLRFLYEKGIVSDEGVKSGSFNELAEVLYIQKDKRAIKTPVEEVLKLSDARKRLLEYVFGRHPHANVDSVFAENGIYELVVPNLVYDSQTTELVNSEAVSVISPTLGYVTAGQLIVNKDEIVTAEVEQMLDSYKKEYESNVGYAGPRILLWLGNILMALSIVALLFFSIFFSKPHVLDDNRIYYILLVFLIFSVAPLVVARFREDLLYMVPFTLAALYLQAFFRPKLLFPVYVVTLLPLLVFTHNGLILFVMYLLAGSVSIFLFRYLGRGWKQFLLAAVTFGVLAVVYMAFHWLDVVNANVMRIMIYLAAASLMTVCFYQFIYLFEKIFNLVSNSRLMELCDTSNMLVRQLEQKAPGTFHHSLQVMNMADAAARSIDANPLLVRAAALYHDIGKVNNPQCFVENESLVAKDDEHKYHTGLTPAQSAHDIIRHVVEGYELAKSHGIPEKVAEFILTHHGTTVTGYFYNKFLNEGGDESGISDFRYPGPKPKSKEQVILMLCDSIEAASRTLTDYSPESCSRFVEGIFASKMKEGQLENADISIKDIGIVKEELKNYLAQIHHERIVYPKRNKKTNSLS